MRDLLGLLQNVNLSPPWPNGPVCGISEDSEKVEKDWIFVAIQGQKSDGCTQIPRVLAKGVACVITKKGRQQGPRCLGVENPREALGLLCRAFYDYPDQALKTVAVTGTAGKSSTAHLVWQLLGLAGQAAALAGSVFCFDGKKTVPARRTTPLPEELWPFLATAVANGCEYFVTEASSQALAQERLSGLRPQVGVFTNFGQDHLDFHQTSRAYLEAKCRLLTLCDAMVFGVDSPAVADLHRSFTGKKRSFGLHPEADFRASDLRRTQTSDFTLHVAGRAMGRVRLPLSGDFSVKNSLAALASVSLLGLDVRQAARDLEKVLPLTGRMETLYAGDFSVIRDYAHTPESLSLALENLKRQTAGRLILVFGCGGERDRTKRPKMAMAAATLADVIFLTEDNPRGEDPAQIFEDMIPTLRQYAKNFRVVADRPSAIEKAIALAKSGDTVLLAGKGHETTQISGNRILPMNEKEITQTCLKQRSMI